MVEEVKADLVLDLKGLLCPIPVVRVSQAMKGLPVGGVIEVTATDPGVLADIPAWARTTGNEVLSLERPDKVIVFRVRRVR